jgi:ABC-type dipeptide/oligopeptide/nickel transport system ATPase component
MALLVGIIGPSGEGKSTSIRTLNPEETIIIGVAGKELPFKGASKMYSLEKKNYVEISTSKEIVDLLKNISDKGTHVKNIVIDDIQYVMGFEFMKRATEIGYAKFSQIGQNMFNILSNARTLRKDLKVFCLGHSEPVEDGGEIVSYKMKTIGKMLDNNINLEGLFTICLYTYVDEGKNGSEYFLLTNRYKKRPAKSPMEMFDDTLIPNDLKLISEKIDEYYS